MSRRFDGKVALVTGAAAGIGRACRADHGAGDQHSPLENVHAEQDDGTDD